MESFSFQTDKNKKAYRDLMFEEFFLLNQKMNLSLTECKRLPIYVRKWYIDRVTKLVEQQKAQYQNYSSSKTKKEKPVKDIDIDKVNKFFSKFNQE